MRLSKIRTALKAVDPGIKVSSRGCEDGWFMVRVPYHLKEAREAIRKLGLIELESAADIEGTRWDWVHVLQVATPEAFNR